MRPFNKTTATLVRPHPFSTLCPTPLGNSPVWIQSWQLQAVLVLAGLGSCVNHYFIYTSLAYEAASFWTQVSGFWQSRPTGQNIFSRLPD